MICLKSAAKRFALGVHGHSASINRAVQEWRERVTKEYTAQKAADRELNDETLSDEDFEMYQPQYCNQWNENPPSLPRILRPAEAIFEVRSRQQRYVTGPTPLLGFLDMSREDQKDPRAPRCG